MSKWIDEDKFNKFVDTKRKEQDSKNRFKSEYLWKPKPGTNEQPIDYEGRLLPDVDGSFYKKILYHMHASLSGEKYIYVLCPKTYDYNNFCPYCTITNKLYATGNESDKKLASKVKRKTKFATNYFVIDDPRHKDDDDNFKFNGKVWIYEFAEKLETIIKKEMTDEKRGSGLSIFDPGKDGVNLLLSIGLTKKDQAGNTYPAYDGTKFIRTNKPLGSDKQIEDIMGSLHNISDYIKSTGKDIKSYKEILINEKLFNLVKEEWERFVDIPNISQSVNEQVKQKNVEEKSKEVDHFTDDFTDEDLMSELDKLDSGQ